MSTLTELAHLGQSVWLDFIRRSFLVSGELQRLMELGVTGVTSNPTIFQKAIAESDDYVAALEKLAGRCQTVMDVYEALAVEDIRTAADILLPVFRATDGADGFVSLEVNPHLAHDTKGTVSEALRLFEQVDRPNVMIKVPATDEGIPALARLIADGVNVNATLIFSLAHYEAIVDAYISGLEKLAGSGGDVSRVASVASFFLSRVDAAVDQRLKADGNTELLGLAAVTNARLAYIRFGEIFSGDRWERLAAQGARVQRPLWASTSTKDPDYPDTKYVDELIGPQTVNTMPPATLQAFLNHGKPAQTLLTGQTEKTKLAGTLDRLAAQGINLDQITDDLQTKGVASFAKSFDMLLASIKKRCAEVAAA
ncbi:MAG: transaldolase [Desulfocurvibacter africanus]